MKILVVGGGSGGHITPAVAVIREILGLKPRARIEFWTDFKYYKNVTRLTTELGVAWGEGTKPSNHRKKDPYIRVRRIPSGKFHRYANWHFRDYFIHLGITIKDLIFGNIWGFCKFIAGLITAFCRLLLKANRPDIIFLKGGYVCLPVGLIARLFRIPYIIHESDTVTGLTNRLLIKKATKVAFGMPLSEEVVAVHPNYIWTGIPVGAEFKPISATKQKNLKKAFSFSPDKPLVVITGGSQGSENLNKATQSILPELLKFTSVALVAGRAHYEDMLELKRYESWDKANLESDFRLFEFCTTMDELLGAADLVVSRAGATTIAELASLKKPTILVPFARLPGGHQVKNAEYLQGKKAVAIVNDEAMCENPDILLKEIKRLIKNPASCSNMADIFAKEARSDAAKHLAEIITSEVK